MIVTTLVPRLRPAIDGVGDYACKVASQIHEDFDIKTQFIVGDPKWQRNTDLGSVKANVVRHRSTDSLFPLLQGSSTVILHYVPHGYAQKACPFWLIKALERWHTSTSNARLITMFHELYALDWHRPWSSDFYLSPVQQHLAARIAQLSDICLTSTERYQPLIQRLSRGKHTQTAVLPVPSNMGELAQVLPLSQRQPRLILFGQRRTKGPIYSQCQPLLKQICQTLAIQEIWDIGPAVDGAPTNIETVPVKQLGPLAEKDISQILSESLAGFLNYDPKRLAKSGIFAAYCAHGMLPINHTYTSPTDGLITNQHYWCPPFKPAEPPDIETIAGQALAWYQNHTLAKQAAIFRNAITTCDTITTSHTVTGHKALGVAANEF